MFDLGKMKTAMLQSRHNSILLRISYGLQGVMAHIQSGDRSRAWDRMMALDTWCDGVWAGLEIPYGGFNKTPKRIQTLKTLLIEVQKVGRGSFFENLKSITPSPDAIEALAARVETMIQRTGRDAS